MPTYLYRCKKGHEFEVFHSITDETPRRCPQCRSGAKRVPAGGAGFLFKGSGFYITDYRSKGYQDSAKKEKGGSEPAKTEKSGKEGTPKPPTGGGGGEGGGSKD